MRTEKIPLKNDRLSKAVIFSSLEEESLLVY